ALAKEEVPDSVMRAYGLERLRFGPDYLIPKPFDPRVLLWVAPAVAWAAVGSGVAGRVIDGDEYRAELDARLGGARGARGASGAPPRTARRAASRGRHVLSRRDAPGARGDRRGTRAPARERHLHARAPATNVLLRRLHRQHRSGRGDPRGDRVRDGRVRRAA